MINIALNASDAWHLYVQALADSDLLTGCALAAVILIALGCAGWALCRRRSIASSAEIDREIIFAFGAQCPNCSARLSEMRGGSIEKRRCGLCGQKFELD